MKTPQIEYQSRDVILDDDDFDEATPGPGEYSTQSSFIASNKRKEAHFGSKVGRF